MCFAWEALEPWSEGWRQGSHLRTSVVLTEHVPKQCQAWGLEGWRTDILNCSTPVLQWEGVNSEFPCRLRWHNYLIDSVEKNCISGGSWISKSSGSLPILGFYDIPCGRKRGEAGKKKKTEERGGESERIKYKKRQEGRPKAGDRSMHGPNIQIESAEFLRGWCLNGCTECHSILQHPPIPVLWAKPLGLAPPRGHEAHLSSVCSLGSLAWDKEGQNSQQLCTIS